MKVLVIADIHGNATALKAILEKETEFDSVVFLGDAVSPGPQPNETIELLMDLNGVFIRGNHEYVMLNPDSIKKWPDGFKALMEWNIQSFDSSGVQYLQSFDSGGEFNLNGCRWHLRHGDECRSTRHVIPDSPEEYFLEIEDSDDGVPVLFGHSHVQFRRQVRNSEFINPGSVGQNRCGRVSACYGLLIDGEFSHHHVEYDLSPWLDAVDRIPTLRQFESFREMFKQMTSSGYANGKTEPWTELNLRNFR